jgi:radical SAM protein with 4Fe4S-binding SPASM domain
MSSSVPYIEKKRPWEKGTARRSLAERLPLSTPLSIQIDPSSLCNFRCRFCPTGHPELLQQVGRSKGQIMSWQLYEKLVNDITAFPEKIKSLSLHKDGEPLLNKRLADMVALARTKGIAEKIVILTNAALLTRETAVSLIQAGTDVIRISVEHATSEGYKAHTQVFGDYGKIVANVRALREERDRLQSPLFISAKIIDLGLSAAELEIFSRDFGPICDEIGRTTAQGWSHSELFDFTLGTKPSVALDGHTPLKPQRITCPFPFYTLAVNANGIVSPCPDDWTLKAMVGDANKESLVDIWNGEKMRAFRIMHLRNHRKQNPACCNCGCVIGTPEDTDLDAALERLIPIYEGGK